MHKAQSDVGPTIPRIALAIAVSMPSVHFGRANVQLALTIADCLGMFYPKYCIKKKFDKLPGWNGEESSA